jgi:hypothetical protein
MMGWISDRDMRPGGSMSDSEARWCGDTLAQHDELEKAVREFLADFDVDLAHSFQQEHRRGHFVAVVAVSRADVAPLRAALEKRHRG